MYWKRLKRGNGFGDLYIYNAKCSQCRNGTEERELEDLVAMLKDWVGTGYFPRFIVSPCRCSLQPLDQATSAGSLGKVQVSADDRTQGQQAPGELQQPDSASGLPGNAIAECDGEGKCPAGDRQDAINELHTRFVLLIAELFDVIDNRFNRHACPLSSGEPTPPAPCASSGENRR